MITAKYFFQNVLTNNSDESNCWSHSAFDVLCVQFRRYFMQKSRKALVRQNHDPCSSLGPADAFVKARAGA
jgi:hypothetical protein